MEGLVPIALRHGDVVLEPSRLWRVELVNDSQRGVALRYRAHHHPYGDEIENLVEFLVVFLHLLVDAVKIFCSSLNVRINTLLLQLSLNLLDELLGFRLALLA